MPLNGTAALSNALENLQTAYHKVTDTVGILPHCGSLSLLYVSINDVHTKLAGLIEISAALLDMKIQESEDASLKTSSSSNSISGDIL